MSSASEYGAIAIQGGDTATPLNLAKRLRRIEVALGDVKSQRILDCGCGEGEYVVALRSLGARADGVEFEAAKLAAFEQRYPEADWVRPGDLQRLEYPDQTFDAVLINEVLEHVPDDSAALREAHRVLKPGGRLVLFAPNRLYPFETHGVYRIGTDRKVSPAVPGIPYLPVRFGRRLFRYWARNYWPWELRRRVSEAGFHIDETGYVWQTFENISGRQPAALRILRPLLRSIAEVAERIPLLRSLGVSQLIVARR